MVMSSPPKRIINLLLDLSGTLHISDSPTPGSIEALSKLRRAAKLLNQKDPGSLRLRFCLFLPSSPIPFSALASFQANTSKESSNDLLSRLHKIGFSDIKSSELFTSLDACAKLCSTLNLKPLLLLSPSATKSSHFESLSTSFSPHLDINSNSSRDEPGDGEIKRVRSLSREEKKRLKTLDSVVIGLEPSLMTYDWLNEAFRILSNEYGTLKKGQNGRLIATHRASYFRPSTHEALSLGPGAFVQGLETAVGVTATICGKPTRGFFEACLKDMDDEFNQSQDFVAERRNIIVGDDVQQDLGDGAIEMGLQRILVRTGKYRAGDEGKASKSLDGVFDSLAAFVDSLMDDKDFEACQ